MALSIALSSFILLIKPNFISASIISLIQGIASAGITPLITGITIGLTDKDKLGARFSKNEAWNHFGNALTAALSGLLGYYYGILPVFIIMSTMALLAANISYSAAFIGLTFMAFSALFVFIYAYKYIKGFAV